MKSNPLDAGKASERGRFSEGHSFSYADNAQTKSSALAAEGSFSEGHSFSYAGNARRQSTALAAEGISPRRLPRGVWQAFASMLLAVPQVLPAQTALTLFNGTTLTGWTQHGSWSVSGGVMTSAGSTDRSILTAVPFSDCTLQFEYNQSAPMDAELRLWTSREASGGLVVDLDTNGGKNGTGGIETLSHSSLKNFAPGWHRVDVNASHGTVSVRVDGTASGNASALGSRAGYIGFSAGNGGTLQIRNVKLTPLNLNSTFNGTDLSGWKSIPTEPNGKGSKAEKIATFGIGGGAGKPHEAKWSVKGGALHGEAGPGALENEAQMEDGIIQMNVTYRGDAKPENLTALSLRNTPGKMGTGYEAGLGPFAGTVNHVGKSPLGKPNASMDETIVIAGRSIATWVNGALVSVHTDSRPDAGNAAQGARTQPGTTMLVLPNDHEQIDISRLNMAALPKTYGVAAKAPPPPPPTVTPAAASAPTASPANAGDSAAAKILQQQQQDQARKDAEANASKQRVASLMSGALASNDPKQQEEMYRQALEIDPANPNAMQGFKDAQARAQQQESASTQAANSEQSEKQKQEQANASLMNAQSAFLGGNLSAASQALSAAERLTPNNPMVRELRRRIGAAQSARSRLVMLGSGAGLLALLAGLAAWLRRRKSQRFPILEVISGVDTGKIYRIEKDETRIGAVPQDAGQKNDIVVRDVEHAISRFHCEITRRDGQLYVHDLNSSNGTRVDGERLPPGTAALLRKGTRIQLANTVELRFGYDRGSKKP